MRTARTLLWCVTLMTFLLVGCKHQEDKLPQSSVAVMPLMPVSEDNSQEYPMAEDVQNQREMELVMLFKGLIVMDRQPSLTLSPGQSRTILPVARKCKEEGSIDESERKEIIHLLTNEQKAFLDEQSKQVTQRMADRISNNKKKLSSAEREMIVNAYKKKRNVNVLDEPDNSDRVYDKNQSNDLRNLGVSVEEQLISLLVTKS